MTLKELKDLEQKKLQERLLELRSDVMKLRFGLVNRQVKNLREVRKIRKEIAQIMTLLNEKRTAKAAAPKAAETVK